MAGCSRSSWAQLPPAVLASLLGLHPAVSPGAAASPATGPPACTHAHAPSAERRHRWSEVTVDGASAAMAAALEQIRRADTHRSRFRFLSHDVTDVFRVQPDRPGRPAFHGQRHRAGEGCRARCSGHSRGWRPTWTAGPSRRNAWPRRPRRSARALTVPPVWPASRVPKRGPSSPATFQRWGNRHLPLVSRPGRSPAPCCRSARRGMLEGEGSQVLPEVMRLPPPGLPELAVDRQGHHGVARYRAAGPASGAGTVPPNRPALWPRDPCKPGI